MTAKSNNKVPTSNEIRNILVQVWDPIGVGNTPEGMFEYESFTGSIILLFRKNAPKTEIINFLCAAEIELALSPNKARAEKTADKLLNFKRLS